MGKVDKFSLLMSKKKIGVERRAALSLLKYCK